MAISNINWDALNRLNDTFGEACRIGNAQPTGGDTVLRLQNGEQLTCAFSADDAPKSLTRFMFTRTDEQVQRNNDTREIFKQAVINVFGNSINDVPSKVRSAMKLDKFDGTGRPLTARRLVAVSKAIDAEMAALAKKFGITGAAASGLVSFVTSNSDILRSQNPVREFKTLANRHATASMATHIAAQASKNMDYDGFVKDVNRGMGLRIGGKRASQNADEARDMVVRFITGGKTDTFDTVDERTQRKAKVLMSLMHQGSIACFMTGVGGALDHTAQSTRLGIGQLDAFGGQQHNSFAITKDGNGNITIKGEVLFSDRFLVNLSNGTDSTVKASDNNGVRAQYKGTIRLSSADLDKLADADWTKYDHTQVNATDSNANIPDRFKAAADLIPPAYKFTGSVEVSFKLHVNRLLEMGELG